jgi:hypothetical protein
MLRKLTLVALAASLSLPTVCAANRMACPPGRHPQVFAYRYLPLPAQRASEFNARVEKYANANGLDYGGAELPAQTGDPCNRKSVFLESASVATVIEIDTSICNRWARITIGSNCFEKRENWRPYWKRFNRFLSTF